MMGARPVANLFTWCMLCLSLSLLAACAEAPSLSEEAKTPAARPATADKHSEPTPAVAANPVGTTPKPVLKRGGGFYKDDGPGDNPPPDLAAIPDAEPRAEPLFPLANRPYNALGQDYTPMQQLQPYSKRGVASWYGRMFNGKRTSSGEPYDMYAMTGAHPTLPIPSYVRVTNVANNRSVIVRINDRGPFHSSRIIDLSYTAAWKLGYADRGSAEVLIELIVPDEIDTLVATVDKKSPTIKVAERKPAPTPAPAPAVVAKPEAVVLASVSDPLPAKEVHVEAPSTAAASPANVYLQLGAFASRANADSFRDYVVAELKWLTQGVASHYGGDKYRLHLGPFHSLEEARNVAERIAQVIKLRPFVVLQ